MCCIFFTRFSSCQFLPDDCGKDKEGLVDDEKERDVLVVFQNQLPLADKEKKIGQR